MRNESCAVWGSQLKSVQLYLVSKQLVFVLWHIVLLKLLIVSDPLFDDK